LCRGNNFAPTKSVGSDGFVTGAAARLDEAVGLTQSINQRAPSPPSPTAEKWAGGSA